MLASSFACEDPAARQRWHALWHLAPQRTAFSSLEFVQAAGRAFGLRTRIHLVSRDGEDLAGAAVLWQRKRLHRMVVVPPFTQYSGLVVRTPPAETEVNRRQAPVEYLLQALEGAYGKARILAAVQDPRPALWRGWKVLPLYTYVLDPGAGQRDWSRSTRRTCRRHAAAFEVSESPDYAHDVVSLCAESYARRGRRLPGSAPAVLELIAHLGASVRCFVARRHGAEAPEAGLAALHDERTAHYWIAGSVPGPSMTVLIGRVLSVLRTDGIRAFDFVGANTAPIAEFKRRFGPTLTPYYAFLRNV